MGMESKKTVTNRVRLTTCVLNQYSSWTFHSLRLFLQEKRGSPDDLVRFARVCRVEKVMRPYLEALL